MEGCYGVVLEYVFTEIPSKGELRDGVLNESFHLFKPNDASGYLALRSRSYRFLNFVREGKQQSLLIL